MRKILPLLLVLLSCSGIYGYFAITNRPDRSKPDPEDAVCQLGTEGINLYGYCNRGDNVNLLESVSGTRGPSSIKIKIIGHPKIIMQNDKSVSYPERADYVLQIDHEGKHIERKAKGITGFIWLEARQAVIFIQADSTTIKDARTFRLWQWNAKEGFRPLTRSYRYLYTPSLSVDGRYVVTKTNTRIVSVYDLEGKSEAIIQSPENCLRLILYNRNTMLYLNAEEGCFFRKDLESKQETAFELDGYFTALVGYNGSLWGIRRKGKHQEIVQLNGDLTRVVEKVDLPL